MSDNKIQTQIPVTISALEIDRDYVANENGDMVNARGEVCGSVDYDLGVVNIKLSANPPLAEVGEPFIPINPKTGEPYFHSVFEENDAVWIAQKIIPIPDSEFGGDDE